MAVLTYKCPNCGAGLQFDPETQKYKCEYCETEFTQEEIEDKTVSEEERPAESNETSQENTDAVMYHCPSCGAEIITDETTAATFCYYCHNPVVLSGKLDGTYKPDYVLPFKIDRKKAESIFSTWIAKKKFVPSDFYSQKQIETMTGTYFPYLLYNCQVEGKIDAIAVKSRVWTVGSTEYTEVSNFQVCRDGQMKIENLTRNALKKSNRQLIEGVLPFDMKEKEAFSTAYLTGFQAEKRDMETSEFEKSVNGEVMTFADNKLKNSLAGYSRYNITNNDMHIESSEWKYALLPVWTMTYKDKGKRYYFSINGQTGKICGEIPVDNRKLAGYFATIFAPIFIVLLIVGYFL